jgi:hypothetical protein
MLPYKTRRSVLAVFYALLGAFSFYIGCHWMKTSRELGAGDMALALAQFIVAGVVWKRRNEKPPTV